MRDEIAETVAVSTEQGEGDKTVLTPPGSPTKQKLDKSPTKSKSDASPPKLILDTSMCNGEMPGAGRGRKRGRSSAAEYDAAKKSRREKISHRSFPNTDQSGQVLTLGEGDVGQLGLGPDIMERTKPAKVNIPPDVVQVCAGGMHTVCLTSTGKVVTFGCNDEGALGRPTTEEGSETEPGEVELAEKIIYVCAGDSHTAALTEDGRCFAWGTFRDASGCIGLTADIRIQTTPMEVMKDHVIVKIASGSDHLVFLTDEGEVFTVGNAEQGQLGRVSECFSMRGGRKGLGYLLTPERVKFTKRKCKFGDIWTGQYITFAQDRDSGAIYAWGLNNYQQLGFDDLKNRYVPELVRSFSPDKGWVEISGGQHHTIALDKDGKVYSLGRKEYGRLGLGEDTTDKTEPTPIPALQSHKCRSISTGTATSFAVTEEGDLYAWGMGTSSQLAQSEDDDLFEPTEMKGKQLETRTGLMISAGGQHTVLLAKDNE